MSSTPVATSVNTSRAKRRMREMVATWLARPIFFSRYWSVVLYSGLGTCNRWSWSWYQLDGGDLAGKAHLFFTVLVSGSILRPWYLQQMVLVLVSTRWW